MDPSRYSFRPMIDGDLPRVVSWLAEPHVAAWWHDGEDFEFVSGDLDHPDFAQFIVACDERPFAYLQCYRISDWHVSFGPQPPETRGLDQFIGDADMVGRGHGSAFVAAFAEGLFARGVPRVVVDPRPDNSRAIRAYEKAGFTRDREVTTPDGPALLMVRNA
ncbi:GNAT family N-acetyltransferase [Aquabacter sp. CN5-332]|uniref:GNAT family N-acetyltransferase n=1 Tax=Aquabacter sp. CN5-332 TaxID=3156608 RepID=UPI0032B3326F